VEKGAASTRMRANASLYEPLVEEGQARRTEVRALVERAFDGAFAPLLRFVLTEEKLSAAERAELRALLDRAGVEENGRA
jgi:BlaI family transcriptional regulator, penicillinase repressor